jgi:hypothetical protein
VGPGLLSCWVSCFQEVVGDQEALPVFGVALVACNRGGAAARGHAQFSACNLLSLRDTGCGTELSEQEKAERAESGFERPLCFLCSLLLRTQQDDWSAREALPVVGVAQVACNQGGAAARGYSRA